MQYSINELAQITKFDRRTVSKRLENLTAEAGPNRAKLYESHLALPLLYGVHGDGEKLDPQAEKAMLDRERRRQIEMTNAKLSGELLPRDEVAQAWAQHVASAKARLLSVPARVAPALVRAKDMRSMEEAVRSEIFGALQDISDTARATT